MQLARGERDRSAVDRQYTDAVVAVAADQGTAAVRRERGMRMARLVADRHLAHGLHLFALDGEHGNGALDAVGDERQRAGLVDRDARSARAGAQAADDTRR